MRHVNAPSRTIATVTLTSFRVLITGGSGFIGTNLIEALSALGADITNFDVSAPLDFRHRGFWTSGDVRDGNALEEVLRHDMPTHVIHLAARVDIKGQTLDDYSTNVVGTTNLLNALRTSPEVQRVIVASTQFVGQPGHVPTRDDDYKPHTAYGQSKVEAEKLTRQSDLPWVIIRPTTIWGPHDLSYRRMFYRVMDRGLYLHPGRIPCHRSMGFVGNLVDQVLRLLTNEASRVLGSTFYLGDPVVNLINFVDEFSLRITGRPARTAPPGVLRALAHGGDLLQSLRLPAPITTGRLASMTEDFVVPIEDTFAVTGAPPISLEAAVKATVDWLEAEGVVRKRR